MNEQSYSAIKVETSPYFTTLQPQFRMVKLLNRSKRCYTDEEIMTGLKRQDIPILKFVYKQFSGQVKSLITSNSGTEMDAEDIFQDALVVIYQKISSDTMKLTCSFSTYLTAVCKYLWLQRLNKLELFFEFKELACQHEEQDDFNMEQLLIESEKYRLFQQHFLRLTPDDQKVLRLFMSKISLKEIAKIMGYKSHKYAKVRKYICKEKLKNSILNDPQFRKIYEYDELTPVMNWEALEC
jgi:RNA polymerase sigma factor (sigma-70 family)